MTMALPPTDIISTTCAGTERNCYECNDKRNVESLNPPCGNICASEISDTSSGGITTICGYHECRVLWPPQQCSDTDVYKFAFNYLINGWKFKYILFTASPNAPGANNTARITMSPALGTNAASDIKVNWSSGWNSIVWYDITIYVEGPYDQSLHYKPTNP